MPQNIITVQNLYKSFGDNEVITDLSFDVHQGEIFAFLGANGSGKTTTIRCLLNILQPTSGELLINGQRYSHEMSEMLGYLPEERGLYTTSKVLETMVYFGTLKGVPEDKARKWSLDYLAKVGIKNKTNEKIKRLSSGEQQKVQLGITIINQPELLVLDEPTRGLDPVNRELLMEMLADLNKQGSTIVFITHQMEEVEKIAQRLLMIKDGKKVLYGDVDEVRNSFGENTVHLQFKGEFPFNDKLYLAKVEKNYAEITPQEGIEPKQILKFLIAQEIKILKYEVAAPSLQQIFIKVSNDK